MLHHRVQPRITVADGENEFRVGKFLEQDVENEEVHVRRIHLEQSAAIPLSNPAAEFVHGLFAGSSVKDSVDERNMIDLVFRSYRRRKQFGD